MSGIPQIVLEEREGSTVQASQSVTTGGQQTNPPGANKINNAKALTSKDSLKGRKEECVDDCDKKDSASVYHHQSLPTGHVPIRSSSDIGLPGNPMPNLSLSLMAGGGALGTGGGVCEGGGGGESYLGVYCSPRASRRSMDLDVTVAREEVHGGARADIQARYDWSSQYNSIDFGSPSVNTMYNANTGYNNNSNSNNAGSVSTTASCNTLRVLTSSSRAASALSLTSDCTARSIGLLSNDGDSDSDADASLMSDTGASSQGQGKQLQSRDGAAVKAGAAQLRRYLSHPEESVAVPASASDVGHARPSVSLINIKSAQASMANPVDASRTGAGKLTSGQASLPHSATLELDGSAPSDPPTDDPTPAAHRTTDPTAQQACQAGATSDNPDGAASGKPVGKSGKNEPKTTTATAPFPSSYKDGEPVSTIPPSLQDGSLHKRTRKADAEERIEFTCGGARLATGSERSGQKILSYKCDPNDTSRNGRIRQWLQDMDKVDLSTG